MCIEYYVGLSRNIWKNGRKTTISGHFRGLVPKKGYFEPCLFQVLSDFCVLIILINPICTLRSLLYY